MSTLNKDAILSNFPNVKLSYENITHKKVYNSNYIVAVPVGKKCFIWFTTLSGKPICLLLELDKNKKVQEIKMAHTKFSHDLAEGNGTIIYGTKFYYNSMNFFSIEDIFYYKGCENYNVKWQGKLTLIKDLLENNIYQKSYNGYLTFGLPIMCSKMEEFENVISQVGYRIDSVQFYLYNRINSYLTMDYRKFTQQKVENTNTNTTTSLFSQFGLMQAKPLKQENHINKETNEKKEKREKKEIVLQVRADLEADIYNLYCLNGELEFVGLAHIPDYNTSVMMNKLFRIIKENENLDALEESDDEDEFENEKEDKYVHLDKIYNMVCEYNHKFKKWTPLRVAAEKAVISNANELKYFNIVYEQNKKKGK